MNGGEGNSVKSSSTEQIKKLITKEWEVASVQLCSISIRSKLNEHRKVFSAKIKDRSTDIEELNTLLTRYETIFWKPKGLPPSVIINT